MVESAPEKGGRVRFETALQPLTTFGSPALPRREFYTVRNLGVKIPQLIEWHGRGCPIQRRLNGRLERCGFKALRSEMPKQAARDTQKMAIYLN
jgi:hypothetical protein